MSAYASKAVWEYSKSKGAARLVMLCLAYHMNDEKREAWPGMATIIKETGVSKRQVERAIEQLSSDKEIEVVGGGLGRGNAYTYRFLIPVQWPQPEPQKPKVATGKGDTMTPYSPNGKGDTVTQKGDILSQKGDTMTRPPYRTDNNNQEQLEYDPPPSADEEYEKAIHESIMETITTFERITNKKRPYSRIINGRRTFKDQRAEMVWRADWLKPAYDMKVLANGRTEELMGTAYQELLDSGFKPGSPGGIYTTFVGLYNKTIRPSNQADNPYANDVSNGKGW